MMYIFGGDLIDDVEAREIYEDDGGTDTGYESFEEYAEAMFEAVDADRLSYTNSGSNKSYEEWLWG